jgi:hypothetical protein
MGCRAAITEPTAPYRGADFWGKPCEECDAYNVTKGDGTPAGGTVIGHDYSE